MFSLGASGSLADTLTFSVWKGRAYARQLVIPSNPGADKQLSVRAMMKWLSQNWSTLAGADQLTWEDLAEAEVISPFNAYIKNGLARWRNFLGPSEFYPPATIDTPPVVDTGSAVGGVRMATVTMSMTTENQGTAVLFFRKTGSAVTAAFDNLVAVIPMAATADVVFVDTPLVPATYHYDFMTLTHDGQLTDETQPVNAVVSA